jgi:hypothetical protein
MVLADELEADWEKVVITQARMETRFKGIRLRTSGSGSAAGTWTPLRNLYLSLAFPFAAPVTHMQCWRNRQPSSKPFTNILIRPTRPLKP